MAINNFAVEKPDSGESSSVALSQDAVNSLSFSTSDIQGMALSESGELTISFTDGGSLTINNFRELADNEVQLSLADGDAINSKDLFESLAGTLPATQISQPGTDEAIAYNIETGRKYEMDFGAQKPVDVSEQDGALLITFDNNGLLVLHNFEQVMDSESSADISYDGQFLSLREFAEGLELAEAMNGAMEQEPTQQPQELASLRTEGNNELEALAEELAGIEPAAGEGAGGSAGRGGFGFQSNFTSTPINPIDDVGPIGPTALRYGLPEFQDELFFQETQLTGGFTLRPPTVSANGGVDDAQVKEDGSVYVPITASVGVDSPATTILTVSVSGVDPSWGVTFTDGSYDAGTGIWTITLPVGTITYAGGLTFTPPAESDIDLTGLTATATANDPASGQSATATDGFNIIVDAVADDPSITASGGSDVEGTSIAVNVNGLLGTDNFDGSESITHYQISGTAGYSFNQGTQISPNVWQFTPAELAGLTVKANDPAFDGTVNFTATVFTTENPVSDGEFDTADNNNQASTPLSVTWTPKIDPPTITVNGGIDDAQVKEDNSVDVAVVATLDPAAEPAEYLTVTITGFDPAWGTVVNNDAIGTFNGAGTEWTITLPAGAALDTTFNFAPAAESDIDLTGLVATVTATDPVEGISASGTPDTFNVIVDAVADDPSINATGDSDVEGSVLDVNIAGSLGTDVDGSESIDHYEISGVPAEVSFNQGSNLGGGVWSFTPAQLAGLQATHSDGNFDGTISLTATIFTEEGATIALGGEYDESDNTNSASDGFDLVWTPKIDPPTITVNGGIDDAQVKEDNSVDVTVVAQRAAGAEPAEFLTVTITGFDPAWGAVVNNDSIGSFNGAGTEWTITLPAGQDLNTTFNFAPAAESDLDLSGLVATVTATDPVEGLSANASDNFNVVVDAVADDPSVNATGDSDVEGSVLDVNIAGSLGTDMDGSESIDHYEISGVPAEVSFNQGSNLGGGVWSFTPAQLAGLQATHSNGNFNGTISLTATVFTEEGAVLGAGEFDITDNTNSASDGFDLTWTPKIDPPTIKVNGGVPNAQVKEDNTVDVRVEADLAPGADSDEYLYVKITGFDPAWGAVVNNDSIGSFINGGTEWEITLPAGASLDTTFNFAPAAESDIDLTGLVATATAIDPSEDISASANDDFNVIVDAVADKPTINATGNTEEEGTPIAINISASLGSDNTDGSEVIDHYEISGVPLTGFHFGGAGSNLGGGVWSFTPAEIVGLKIYSTDTAFDGSLNLTAKVVNIETVPASSGSEYDTSDNENFATDAFTVTWEDDDEPLVKDATNTVDETDIGTAAATVGGTLQADFGDDTPGSFDFVGWSSAISLTSNGTAVFVAPTANGFVGTVGTAGGAPVFTLTLNSTTGAYEFVQQGVIDHPLGGANHNDGVDIIFTFNATDSDSDTNPGVLTITVLDDGLTANSDHNVFDASVGTADGNVITGLNGGAGAADDLSNDAPNTVTKIAFGSEVKEIWDGTGVMPTGTMVRTVGDLAYGVSIDGDNGTLTIFDDGSYTYELFASATGGTAGNSYALNPVSSDVSGIQETFTKDGITVSVANSGNFDIKWVSTSDGDGLGIDNLNNGDSTKVWPQGEAFDIGFVENVDTVTLTIAELGNNNDDGHHGLDFTITLADGTTVVGEQQFVPSQIVNGHFTFTIDSSAYGQLIQSIEINSTNAGSYDGASFLLNNVEATTPGTPPADCVGDVFEYTLTDADGDTSVANLDLCGVVPKLLVGENVDDVNSSTTTYHVGDESGIITGGMAGDILIGDVGGSSLQNVDKDYNIVMMLDVSGSMGDPNNSNSRLYKLIEAAENLLTDLNAYTGGEVKVHLVPFSTDAHTAGTFTVTDAGGLSSAISFLNSMPNDGWTNYEAALQSAISWLEGDSSNDPISGAETISYFISDGEPNYYLDNNGNVVSNNNADVSMNQIDGDADGTDEIQQLQDLSDEVIGVGIEIGGTTLGRLGQIDSDGTAINVQDADDLNAALQGANPLNKLASVGGDEITGGDAADLIFGDSVNTDVLADAKGLSTADGAGWEVFDILEAGAGWDRDDTIAYIKDNAEELAVESTNAQGESRQGGDDVLSGGAGDDTIFGQEGDDVISGGLGSDTLYGGSGEDTFLFESIADSAVDTVKDFDAGEDIIDLSQLLSGTSATQATIDQFIFADVQGGNTVLSVDLAGTGNAANATDFAVLEGVSSFDLNALATDGTLVA